MYPLIIAALLLILLGSWLLSVRHKLSVLDENAGSAMSQIGVQLASRFDALNMLLRLPELYALPVVPAILEEIQAKQAPITAESTPAAAEAQAAVIAHALSRLSAVDGYHTALASTPDGLRCLNAMNGYEKMLRTSYLIYNDSAAGLNRVLDRFPVSIAARLLGFHPRGCLPTPDTPLTGHTI